MSSSKSASFGRWLKAILAFGIILAAADALFTFGIIARSDTFDAGKVWRCLHAQAQEMPIFGASNVRADFIPKEIGLDVFNYGMDASSYEVVDVLLKAELQKKKTVPVVLGMSYHLFHNVGDISKFIPFAWNADVRQALEQNHAMSWRFLVPGLRYFGYYDWYFKDFLSEHLGLTRNVDRGYEYKLNALAFDPTRFAEAVKKRRETGYGYSEDPEDIEKLTARILCAPQREFVLVFLPIHDSCFENFTGKKDFTKALARWRRIPNVRVLDYSELRYPDEYFTDTMHLNQKGAVEFSRRFGADLRHVLERDAKREGIAGLGVPVVGPPLKHL
jgi:hypothetical protein